GEEEALRRPAELDPTLQRALVVAQMHAAGGAHPGDHAAGDLLGRGPAGLRRCFGHRSIPSAAHAADEVPRTLPEVSRWVTRGRSVRRAGRRAKCPCRACRWASVCRRGRGPPRWPPVAWEALRPAPPCVRRCGLAR